MTDDPKQLTAGGRRLTEYAEEAGRPTPSIVTFARIDPRSPSRAEERVASLREAGVSHIVAGARYEDADDFAEQVAFLAEHVLPATG
jgi:hypothetical protein